MLNIVCKAQETFFETKQIIMPKNILKSIYIYTWSALSAVLSTEQIKLPSSLCNVDEETKGVFSLFFWIIVLELES